MSSPPNSKITQTQRELMAHHLKFGATVTPPLCPGCLYGKATRHPWQSKTSFNPIAQTVSAPGDCISVDQMISKVPGPIAQSTGKLTLNHYNIATIFVDNFSSLDYVHLQQSTSAEDTIKDKLAFECFATYHGIHIKHYHADNGIYASKAFRKAINSASQTISFCGVNAHHQNGVAK